jgi:threonine/homoserine/homoserine lactone efflux protein
MKEAPTAANRTLLPTRLAVLLTALALLLGLALLIKETPYVFTVFMVLGPLLLAAAFLLLGWVIARELRSKRIL